MCSKSVRMNEGWAKTCIFLNARSSHCSLSHLRHPRPRQYCMALRGEDGFFFEQRIWTGTFASVWANINENIKDLQTCNIFNGTYLFSSFENLLESRIVWQVECYAKRSDFHGAFRKQLIATFYTKILLSISFSHNKEIATSTWPVLFFFFFVTLIVWMNNIRAVSLCQIIIGCCYFCF